MLQNKLKLNDDKTELLVAYPKKFLSHLSLPWSLAINNSTIPFSTPIRSLGVIVDQNFPSYFSCLLALNLVGLIAFIILSPLIQLKL